MSGKAIRETLAALGVIASMVFVGLEIRQNAEATRGATVLQLKENWSQFNLTILQNPEIVDALDLVLAQGFENVDRRSQKMVSSQWLAMLHNWSNAYYQYRINTLEEEQWQAILRDMEFESTYGIDVGATPPVWDVWDRSSYHFDDSFRTLMDSLRVANFEAAP